jgi:hypothetical protein
MAIEVTIKETSDIKFLSCVSPNTGKDLADDIVCTHFDLAVNSKIELTADQYNKMVSMLNTWWDDNPYYDEELALGE